VGLQWQDSSKWERGYGYWGSKCNNGDGMTGGKGSVCEDEAASYTIQVSAASAAAAMYVRVPGPSLTQNHAFGLCITVSQPGGANTGLRGSPVPE